MQSLKLSNIVVHKESFELFLDINDQIVSTLNLYGSIGPCNYTVLPNDQLLIEKDLNLVDGKFYHILVWQRFDNNDGGYSSTINEFKGSLIEVSQNNFELQ